MIYDNIQRLCKEHKISIHKLEQNCGIANNVINKWADKVKSPGVLPVKAIADYFGVTVDELLKE